jgi:AhpC/TSA family
MDFWATWCLPCRAELPKIELLHRDFKDKGLIVLGVDDEEPKDQAAFLSKFGYTFRSLVDSSEQVKNLSKTAGIPTTVLIDREGTIQVFDLGSSSYDTLRDGKAYVSRQMLEHYSHIRSQAKLAAIRCLEDQAGAPALEAMGTVLGYWAQA